MPDQIIPVEGLDTVGLIEDVPPVSLPPNAFSDCRNVRFRDGAIHKIGGDLEILPYIRYQNESDVLKYIVWWPNPNLAIDSLGYYLLIVQQGIRDYTYLVKVDEAGTFEQPLVLEPGSVNDKSPRNEVDNSIGFEPSEFWQHTFFQGGFALIVNNGLQSPHFILDREENVETANVMSFADLPGWDSYAVRVNTFSARTFDRSITLTNNNFINILAAHTPVIEGETLEVSSITIADGFIDTDTIMQVTVIRPIGADPFYRIILQDNTFVNTDSATIMYRTMGETAATVTAGVIRTYGDFLIAGNLVERDIDGSVLRALPNTIRSSDIAAPGQIPQNWNPFSDAVNTADEFTVTGDGIVQDFAELQGNMYVYSNSSISVISRTGNPITPLSVRPVTSAYGALTTDSVIEFDGRHFVVGAQDIYLFGGHPGSITSIGDKKVRRAFYDSINLLNLNNLFVIRYNQRDEIWLCYPSQTSTGGRSDQALIWNYRNQTWTRKDLQGVVAGDIGPVPGGGLPRAEYEFGGSPVIADVTPGVPHRNTIFGPGDILMEGSGDSQTIRFSIPDNFPTLEPTGDPVIQVNLLEDFWTGGLQTVDGETCPTLRFTARSFTVVGVEPVETVFSFQLPALVGNDPTTPDDILYNTASYKANVVDVITDGLAEHPSIGYDDTTPVTIHPVTDEYANVAFILQFHGVMTTNIDIQEERQIDSEHDVDEMDRPFFPDGGINNGVDIRGARIFDSALPNAAETATFSMDFADIIDDLEDYVFFYKGAVNNADEVRQEEMIPISPTENRTVFNTVAHYTYDNLPEGYRVRAGLTMIGNTQDSEDGGDRFQSTGDVPTDRQDGYRRVNISSNGLRTILDPLTGTEIRQLINASAPVDSTEIALVLDRVDIANVTEFNLIAYRIPKVSDGNADYELVNAILEGNRSPAVLTFNVSQAEYDKETNSYQAATELPPIVASLGFVGNTTSPTFRFEQRVTFAGIMGRAFDENPLFSAQTANDEFTVSGINNIPYVITSITIEGGDISPTSPQQSFPGVLVDHEITTQGRYDFTNGTPTGNQRRLIPPCIRITHSDPDLPFFNFDTGLINLVREEGNNEVLTVSEWVDLINNAIQAAVPNQWAYSNFSWTSQAVMYNQANGDTGVPVPNNDGTYDFPAGRAHNDFVISSFSPGSGTIVNPGGGALDLFLDRPVINITQQGVYRRIEPVGSYFVTALSNGISYLFWLGDPATASMSTAEVLRPELLRRIPELQVLESARGISVQPSVIGENSVFVMESYFNIPSTIDDFRRLINPANFTQDAENPELMFSLPDVVLTLMDTTFPAYEGPTIDNAVVTTDFDLDRTWSETQVNYSVEFPIFAAGRSFHDGNTVNKVLASDIGYSIPIFSQTTSGTMPYSSYVERAQMSLVPEFTTELLRSVALWTDGSSPQTFLTRSRYNVLQLNLSVTDNPGQPVDLTSPQFMNTHYISEDYKMDTRVTGRFLNWRISDDITMPLESPGGKMFNQQTEWRLSGLQLEIRTAGRR